MNVLLPRATAMVLDKWKVIYAITPELMGTSMLWMMSGLQNEDPARYVAHCRAPEVTRALAVQDPAIWQQWFKPLHLLPADAIEQVTSEDGWFRFGWARHPVDRLWSAWQSKLLLREPLFVELYGTAQWFPRSPKELSEGRRRWWARRTAPALGAIAEGFERFVAALAQDLQLLTADPHWAPQSYLLRPKVFPYSEIGRIESAPVTLGRLESHLRAQGWRGTLDLKRLNVTLLPRVVIRDPTLLRLIEKIYSDDMTAFEYEPANVGRPPSADASAIAVRAMAELVERHERIDDLHRMLAQDYYPGAPGGSPEVE
ncbi:sulfotransferase family 2 domain-containing protein [Mycobacterium sp. THU-M104]|uniref:sulfotransferase family 2 domain-containing protein n=1 Tax=Mycobacterium sp. THU-M104 TaxID=3410515 RepID=UPI003B98EC63